MCNKLTPLRVAIAVTFAIYFRAGKEIYKKRKQLANFKRPPPDPMPIIHDPFTSMKTTEVHVTSESIENNPSPLDVATLGRRLDPDERPQYSVTVSSKPAIQYRIGNMPTFPSKHGLPKPQKSEYPQPTRRYAAVEANSAAWSYTKVAVLFFTALLVTWIPSSANRVYSVVHPDEISVPLTFASSFVLPLQGFWNAIIYIMTSLSACRQVWAFITGGRTSTRSLAPITVFGQGAGRGTRLSSRGAKSSDSESMTELASRPASNDSHV